MATNNSRPILPPLPPELKPLLPFFLRSQEISAKDPIVSYWCKMHLARSAFKYTETGPQVKLWIKALLDVLEWEKKSLANEEAITNDMVAQAHVENFAYQIFSTADKEDQEGKATLKTAKIFLAAANYIEVVVSVFQKDASDDLKEKLKYAKWKVTEITKHLASESIQPPSSPTRKSNTASVPSALDAFNVTSRSPTATDATLWAPVSHALPASTDRASGHPLEQQPRWDAAAAAAASATHPQADGMADLQVISKAQKHARFVISALEYDDIPTAIQNLKMALAILESHQHDYSRTNEKERGGS